MKDPPDRSKQDDDFEMTELSDHEHESETSSNNIHSIDEISYIFLLIIAMKKALPLSLSLVANVGSLTFISCTMSRMTRNQDILGAVGLGNMTLNLILRSYIFGFNNSLMSSLSQAYRTGQYSKMGHIINKSKILFLLCMIPLMIFLFFIYRILLLFGLNERVASNTQFYVRIGMIAFVFHLYFDVYRKMLNSIGLSYVHSSVPYISFGLHIFWCFSLITYFDLGLVGAAISVNIQSLTNLAILYLIVRWFGYGKEISKPMSKEAFEGWSEFLVKGIPSFLLQLISYMSIEIIILLSGAIDTEILIANSALVNLLYLMYLYIYGAVQALSPMITTEIREGNKKGAERIINTLILFGVVFTFISLLILHCFKHFIFYLYTPQESIIEKMDKIVYIYSLALALNNMKDTLVGVIIGLGIQNKTVAFNLVSYLLLGIPLSYYLSLSHHWTNSGPWLGISLANFLNVIYYLYLCKGIDLQWFVQQYRRKYLRVSRISLD
ncbi:unnamed protein product [Moneuplotes crassus]|uniref:Uncharacterized protein n=1 Tax=Euplotes crassus TaxID=5936 RepID=A0AAD1XCT5_EUPCR|nr:unnamed protein product [Moneuplotes crassus]